jgi:uncharacterized protein (UPF0333 family)
MKNKKGQSSIEYFVIMVVILAAIVSTGFIDRMRNAFDEYFNNAVNVVAR